MRSNRLIKTSDLLVIPTSIFTLIIIHWESILFLLDKGGRSQLYFTELTKDMFSNFGYFVSNNLLTANIFTFILWGFIGLICYITFLVFSSEIKDAYVTKNFKKLYKVPKKSSYNAFGSFIISQLIILLFIFGLIAWMYVSFKFLIPYASVLTLTALINTDSYVELFQFLIMSILSISLVYYVPLIMYRLFRFVNTLVRN